METKSAALTVKARKVLFRLLEPGSFDLTVRGEKLQSKVTGVAKVGALTEWTLVALYSNSTMDIPLEQSDGVQRLIREFFQREFRVMNGEREESLSSGYLEITGLEKKGQARVTRRRAAADFVMESRRQQNYLRRNRESVSLGASELESLRLSLSLSCSATPATIFVRRAALWPGGTTRAYYEHGIGTKVL